MLEADGKGVLLDLVQSGGSQELREVPLTSTRERRLVVGVGVELPRRIPEHAQRPAATGVIPDARRHDAPAACHTRHLAQSRDGGFHEVHDELCECDVEGVVSERQLLGRRPLHGDLGMTLSSGRHEGLRWIDRRHRRGSQPRDELGGEGPGAAPHVERELPAGDASEVGERRGEEG